VIELFTNVCRCTYVDYLNNPQGNLKANKYVFGIVDIVGYRWIPVSPSISLSPIISKWPSATSDLIFLDYGMSI
jgi:hypothetical protein